MKVLIYALTDVFYYSFYIQGLKELYGKDSICYSIKEFPAFPERTFSVIVKELTDETKIVIDAFDSPRISSVALNWCDVYGKVNCQQEYIEGPHAKKVLPIGPSFGIRIWNCPETLFVAFNNYRLSRKIIKDKRNFFANYWRQYKRLPLKNYEWPEEVSKNYVYFISSLWKKENDTNLIRAIFIQGCQDNNNINFEGGFAPRSDGNNFKYDSLISERISFKAYLKKISKSILVFNTPAVNKCHGWKLGEYLALGKAIISTEHINKLPSPLEDGKHIHYVAPEKRIIEGAVQLLLEDEQYRRHLEQNARQYYNTNLKPEVVIERVLAHKSELAGKEYAE